MYHLVTMHFVTDSQIHAYSQKTDNIFTARQHSKLAMQSAVLAMIDSV